MTATLLQMCSCRVVERYNLQLQLRTLWDTHRSYQRRIGVCDRHTHRQTHTNTHTDQHKHTYTHATRMSVNKELYRAIRKRTPRGSVFSGGRLYRGETEMRYPTSLRQIRPRLHPLSSCLQEKTQTGITCDALSTEVVQRSGR